MMRVSNERQSKVSTIRVSGWIENLIAKHWIDCLCKWHWLRDSRLLDLLEGHVADPVLPPVFIIKVPPFGFVYGEPFGLHRGAQQRPMPTLQRGAARIIRIS